MQTLKITLLHPPLLAVLLLLAAVVYVFFFPIIPVYFSTDDYNFVGEMMMRGRDYVQGEQLYHWFIEFSAQGLQIPELSIFFRPGVHWLWLIDYIMWGTWAPGFHFTNVTLHLLNSFLTYLLSRQVLRHRAGALIAALLFALHPVHTTAIALASNRVDLLSAFFYISSTLFFVLYRRREKGLYFWVAVAAFFFAVVTKESTVALPLLLLAYDVVFTYPQLLRFAASLLRRLAPNHPDTQAAQVGRIPRGETARTFILIARAQLPFWIVLGVYVTLRFLAFGQFGRNTGGGFLSYGVELFFQFYTMALAQPFFKDMTTPLALVVLSLAAIVIAIYRQRRALWFGLAWIGVSLIPTTAVANVAPRIAYTPSAGLPIALAAILIQPSVQRTRESRLATIVLAGFLLVAYAFGLSSQVDDWRAVGTLAGSVKEETQRLHPTLPNEAWLYYVGVPDILRAILIYNENFEGAVQLFYRNPTLHAARVEKFPIATDNLSRMHFFEFRRRVITERTDLIRALEARKKCLASSAPAIVWDFSRNAQGWETWNQLAPFEYRDGALWTRSLGDDPYMGSPTIDIAASELGVVEIEMRVRADTPMKGALLWLTEGQPDFVPAQTREFDVLPDGNWRTYRVDLAESGKLAFGDRLVRLRLDPTDKPAEITLRSIRVTRWCGEAEAECRCTP